MKKAIVVALILLVAPLYISCGTTSSSIPFRELAMTSDDIDAIIYVYRLPSLLGAAVSWSVKLDGKELAILRQNAYAVLRAAPGEHLIQVGDVGNIPTAIVDASTKHRRTFNAAPKGVYFFRCSGGSQRFVTREEAMKEIVNMKYDMGK